MLHFGLQLMQLNLGLTPQPNQTVTQGIYAVWSFLPLVVCIYIISLSAARINDWAHRVSDIFCKCPNEAYTTEVRRIDTYFPKNPFHFQFGSSNK